MLITSSLLNRCLSTKFSTRINTEDLLLWVLLYRALSSDRVECCVLREIKIQWNTLLLKASSSIKERHNSWIGHIARASLGGPKIVGKLGPAVYDGT